MPSILFVCTANQFRSPIAAAFLLKSIEAANRDGEWIVESAGTWGTAGLPAPDVTLRAAERLGLHGLDRHVTRQVRQELLDHYDLIIVMEKGHKEAIQSEFPEVRRRLYMLSEIVDELSYDVPDPGYSNVNPYAVGRQIEMLISRGMGRILELAAAGGWVDRPAG